MGRAEEVEGEEGGYDEVEDAGYQGVVVVLGEGVGGGLVQEGSVGDADWD